MVKIRCMRWFFCSVNSEKMCCLDCDNSDNCKDKCSLFDEAKKVGICAHQQFVYEKKLKYKALSDYTVCYSCGESVNSDDIIISDINGRTYCSGCYDEIFATCGCCDRECYAEDTTYIDSEDMSVCENCLENFSYCADCDRYYKEGDLFTVYNPDGSTHSYVCISCLENYSSCDDCDEFFTDLNYVKGDSDNDERYVCDNCLDDYKICDICGDAMQNLFTTTKDEHICEECAKKYILCNRCGLYITDDEFEDDNGDVYCKKCYDILGERAE